MLISLRLQGPSIEITVGTGDEQACWSIPVALATKHSEYLRDMVCSHVNENALIPIKIALADRDAAIFRIFMQWMYFTSIPSQWGLNRLSTGDVVSPSFLLWTLGDFLKADAFKNKIMSRLYSAYTLDCYRHSLDFSELSWAEVDYCWSHTAPNSKLRSFIIETLSHHITFGDYIDIKEHSDWYKLFVKHPTLQLQLIAKIAGSSNHFTTSVTDIPEMDTYLEVLKTEDQGEANETPKP
jgi:hypothetical protein